MSYQYTSDEILNHMSPRTLCGFIADLDNMPELRSDKDVALMQAGIMTLFALVGMEAVAMLEWHGIEAVHPLVQAAVAAYNED